MTVRVQDSFSMYKPFPYGVPQGSVLGPRLFSMYFDPIRFIISRYDIRYIIYADELTLYASFSPNFSDAYLTV